MPSNCAQHRQVEETSVKLNKARVNLLIDVAKWSRPFQGSCYG